MRVLITNAQEPQAYTILRSLRPYAEHVAISTGGRSVRVDDFAGMAPFSRHVDSRHELPAFAEDWAAGHLAEGNTPAEERYILAVEAICAAVGIDVILPSLDPEVYVFAKNKARFAARGVVVVVAEPEIIARLVDKALTIQAAEKAGFPVPTTHQPATEAELDTIITKTQPPWVIKPRLGAHMAGVQYLQSAEDLRQAYREAVAKQPRPLVQEYIGGTDRCHFYITVDRNHRVLSVLNPEPLHVIADGVITSVKSVVSRNDPPMMAELQALVAELGLWGSYTVQTKRDPEDGLPKLLEINPRMGHHLWYRTGLGVNEPWICVQLARGETPAGNTSFPDGVMLLDLYHDLFQFLESLFRGRKDQGPERSPQGPRELLRLYRRQYLNRRRKVLCPEFHYLPSDPWPSVRALAFKTRTRLLRPLGRVLRPGSGP